MRNFLIFLLATFCCAWVARADEGDHSAKVLSDKFDEAYPNADSAHTPKKPAEKLPRVKFKKTVVLSEGNYFNSNGIQMSSPQQVRIGQSYCRIYPMVYQALGTIPGGVDWKLKHRSEEGLGEESGEMECFIGRNPNPVASVSCYKRIALEGAPKGSKKHQDMPAGTKELQAALSNVANLI